MKNHTKIMQMLRPTLPSVIHKEYSGKQLTTVADNGDDQLPMMSTDEMIDAMAQALAGTSQ